ncbi:MAG: alpha/beta hydrolase [Stellaceae bacterium]
MPDHPHSHAHPQHLQGLVLPPKSGKVPSSLVVLLHGVGADGNDLLGLTPYWSPTLPDTEFISPHAPFPFDMAPSGRQWFSLQDRSPASILTGVQTVGPILDHFLDELLAERGLDESRLALVGFSQGTMMSLYTGLRRAKAPACIVGYSGALTGATLLAKEIRSRPPVLLVHGEDDPVVPFSALDAAVKALAAVGVKVEALARPGLGHSIDEEGLKRGSEFLTAALAGG